MEHSSNDKLAIQSTPRSEKKKAKQGGSLPTSLLLLLAALSIFSLFSSFDVHSSVPIPFDTDARMIMSTGTISNTPGQESTDGSTIPRLSGHFSSLNADDTTDKNNTTHPTQFASAQEAGSNSSGQRTHQELQPCKVLIKNSAKFHYEILESVGKSFPLAYLNLPSHCDHQQLIFDFYIRTSGIADRDRHWLQYFKSRLRNTSVLQNKTLNNDGSMIVVNRTLARAVLFETAVDFGNQANNYHAIIEASCYCQQSSETPTNKWMFGGIYRSCVFHQRCDGLQDHPRAVWVSPHVKQHFIPVDLPQPTITDDEDANKTIYKTICSLGSTRRRIWGPLVSFLNNSASQRFTKNIRINIIGSGKFPEALHTRQTNVSIRHHSPPNDLKFHQEERKCDVIVLLVSKQSHPHYFSSPPKSQYKLSGAIPPIIAYHKSFVIPAEMLALYDEYLPKDVPHAGYNDSDTNSFIAALTAVLSNLTGITDTHVRL